MDQKEISHTFVLIIRFSNIVSVGFIVILNPRSALKILCKRTKSLLDLYRFAVLRITSCRGGVRCTQIVDALSAVRVAA